MSRIHDYARVISPCGSHTLVWLWLDFGFAPPEQEEPKDAKLGVQGSALLPSLFFFFYVITKTKANFIPKYKNI